MLKRMITTVFVAGWVAIQTASLHANVFTVTSAVDDASATADQMDGKVTLREAVMAASTNLPFGDAPAGDSDIYDIIRLRPAGKGSVVRIKLQEELVIRGTMRIQDHRLSLGANRVEISGEGRCRIFNITPGSLMTMENVDLINGSANYGGAIFIRSAHMNVEHVEFRNNVAIDGGAVIFKNGTGSIDYCSLIDNMATNGGGAIVADLGADVHLANCTLTGNFAANEGGAVLLRRGFTTVQTIFHARSCTIVDNAVGALGEGGGFKATGSTPSPDHLWLHNCIIAGNTKADAKGNSTPDDIDARPFWAFSNLIGFANPGTNIEDGQLGNMVGTLQQPLEPGLGNFRYYGGRTRGFRPLSGSLAVNAGDNQWVDGTGNPPFWVLPEDQRGANRIRGGTVDIGSIER